MKNQFKDQFNYFIINLEAGDLLENFLISAVFATIAIRFFLSFFGFPTFGGDHLHISHMLWGGLLMTFSIFLLIGFLNNQSKQLASIIGGIGFGLFIDELGKYITKNNDYFYQPTIAMIYVIFIMIFLLSRAGKKYFKVTKKDYAINAVEVLKEYILFGFDTSEKNRVISLINRAEQNSLMVELARLVQKTPAKRSSANHFEIRIKHYFDKLYIKLIKNKWFVKTIVTFFIFFSLIQAYNAIVNFKHVGSFVEVGQLLSSIIGGILVIFGIYFLQFGRRIFAFEFFKYSILISIFITQFFLFYQEKFISILLLFSNILIYMVIRYLIAQETIYSIKISKSKLGQIKDFFIKLVK